MPAPTQIALILFDLNGVLYRYDRDARIGHLSSISHQSPDAIKTAIWDSGFEDSGDTGALDADSYLQSFGARIGHTLTEADWLAALKVSVTPIDATLALLPKIRSGVRCAALTNNNLLVRRHFDKLYPVVAALVGGGAYVSAEFGLRKPDPDVYRRCLAQIGVPPEAALFIDDSHANVAGARAAGLHGCDYSSPEALAADLAHLLDT